MNKKNKREIPIRNYIKLGIILLISILALFYLYLWYKTYEENRLNTPIIDNYLSIINYNELDDYLAENKNATIYLSKLNDNNIRNFEKKFKIIIQDNALKNKILYLNLTNELNKNDEIPITNNYTINENNLPIIVIIENSQIKNTYNIKDNDYNEKELEKFLYKNDLLTNHYE